MILITGLTGRSGSAFYDVLCRERYPEKIRVVVRETTNREQFRHTPLDLEFAVGDIRDSAFLDRAMEGCETVFHIANKEIIMMAKEYSAKGLIWPLFSTAIFFLVFVGALTLLFGWLEKRLDYFR